MWPIIDNNTSVGYLFELEFGRNAKSNVRWQLLNDLFKVCGCKDVHDIVIGLLHNNTNETSLL